MSRRVTDLRPTERSRSSVDSLAAPRFPFTERGVLATDSSRALEAAREWSDCRRASAIGGSPGIMGRPRTGALDGAWLLLSLEENSSEVRPSDDTSPAGIARDSGDEGTDMVSPTRGYG